MELVAIALSGMQSVSSAVQSNASYFVSLRFQKMWMLKLGGKGQRPFLTS